jgi:hypothetical protein
LKSDCHPHTRNEIKDLDGKIKLFFIKKLSYVRRCIVPGNCVSIWKAVKTAKDVNSSSLLYTMFEGGIEVINNDLTEKISKLFDTNIEVVLITPLLIM